MNNKCRSCNQGIRWIITANGKRSPINLSDGLPHWASCPEAKQWRKK